MTNLPQVIWLPGNWAQLLSLSCISKCMCLGTDGISCSSAHKMKTVAVYTPSNTISSVVT